jgi:hypothetical protein
MEMPQAGVWGGSNPVAIGNRPATHCRFSTCHLLRNMSDRYRNPVDRIDGGNRIMLIIIWSENSNHPDFDRDLRVVVPLNTDVSKPKLPLYL